MTDRHVFLEAALKHGHGRHTPTPHGHVRQLVRAPMRGHGEQVGPRLVDSTDDEVGTDVALVLKEVLLEHGHRGHDLGFTAGRQGVQL